MSEIARNFDALVQEFYVGWFRFYPAAALRGGVSGYEGGLPAIDDDEIGALRSWLENMVLALEEFDFHALDDDRQLDLQLLFGACQCEYQLLATQDWRQRDPLCYLPVAGVRQLVAAPQIERSEALSRYLSRIPEYLRHARAQLTAAPQQVPRFWLTAALEQGRAERDYLRGLKTSRLQLRGYENALRIRALCDEAAEALDGYLHFLQQTVAPMAAGSPACGESRFLQLLRHRHFLPADPERLSTFVRRVSDEIREQLEVLCKQQAPAQTPATWLEEISTHRWESPREWLEFTRHQCESLRAKLAQNGLFAIPLQPVPLRCVERSQGLDCDDLIAGYRPPVPGDPELRGTLCLDPEENSPAALTARCIRCGWSGYHLLAIVAADAVASGSLMRRLNPAPAMAGGWPLYTEQLLFEHRITVGDDLSLMRLLEQLYHARLALLDLELHLHGMEVDEALRQLMLLPGVSEQRARADLLHLSRFPSDALATVVGWRLLTVLREQQEQHHPEGRLAAFHARLLEQGMTPVPLLIKRNHGVAAWNEAAAALGLICK
jgi:uncharacterized protein (DUF885 family)